MTLKVCRNVSIPLGRDTLVGTLAGPVGVVVVDVAEMDTWEISIILIHSC